MSASSHTFWPSFPTLEATFSTVSDGSWRFGLQQIGVLVDCYMNEVGRGPKILWIPAAMHFGLPSQCWKRPSTLPMMVYGVLVQNILGSWWIDELNMSWEGTQLSWPPIAIHLGFLSNIGSVLQHCQC